MGWSGFGVGWAGLTCVLDVVSTYHFLCLYVSDFVLVGEGWVFGCRATLLCCDFMYIA